MFSQPRSQGDKFGKQKCLVFGIAHVGVLFFFTQASSDSVVVSPKSRYTPLPSASRELTSHRGRNPAFYCILWLQGEIPGCAELGDHYCCLGTLDGTSAFQVFDEKTIPVKPSNFDSY